MSDVFKFELPESRTSSQFNLEFAKCRECRVPQYCTIVNGWDICRSCLENIDTIFTSMRAVSPQEKWGIPFDDMTPVMKMTHVKNMVAEGYIEAKKITHLADILDVFDIWIPWLLSKVEVPRAKG